MNAPTMQRGFGFWLDLVACLLLAALWFVAIFRSSSSDQYLERLKAWEHQRLIHLERMKELDR